MRFNFLTDKNVFEEEEKIILNHLAIEGSKENCCERIEMGISISDDENVKELMESLLLKLEKINESDWSEFQSCLPYDVSILDEDFE